MEKLRLFERRCPRVCLSKFGSPDSNSKKYISNKELYDLANVSRIGMHIIKLIRNYYARLSEHKSSGHLYPMAHPDPNYINTTLRKGYIPPEAFIQLDRLGIITDSNNIPII